MSESTLADITSIEKDLQALKTKGEAFQQKLHLSLQGPDVKPRQRVAVEVVYRVEAQVMLEDRLAELRDQSEEVRAKLRELKNNVDTEGSPSIVKSISALEEEHVRVGRLLSMSKWHAGAKLPFTFYTSDKVDQGME